MTLAAGKVTVTDGPFTEAKELIAGFWLIQVKSKEEAIAWMRRAPFGGGTQIELRQVFEVDELGAAATPEFKAQEASQRARIATRQRKS